MRVSPSTRAAEGQQGHSTCSQLRGGAARGAQADLRLQACAEGPLASGPLVRLGFGRIVGSEIEAPIMLGNLV